MTKMFHGRPEALSAIRILLASCALVALLCSTSESQVSNPSEWGSGLDRII